MTNKEKLANYEMMKNECFETRKLNDSLGKLVVVKNKEIKELEQENKVLTQNLEDTEIVNNTLEKENAELTDELKDLRQSIKDYGARCYENGLRNGKRKLEEQIEKMKCCQNCSHLCGLCELGINGCYVCSKWEVRR